ncbi:PEP-CTERM sorting domain-containing protein [Nitrosospira lacus]|uniref:PEP-CTERM sorting domain-containing protein n=1 Tax=Nitrosospira lacus TaxID=1288494 RepID=UPI0002C533F3|nr:PEP-CTERM sorting domain-containing protein [Nitrosospira lacus]ASD48283.1 PEP-CTERM sorting domain-containing protein [Nitrosospira lacus]
MSYLRPLPGLLFALAISVYQPLGYAAVSTSYSFANITHNNAGAEADGEANLKVEVIDLGSHQVRFNFTNTSTSSLTDVYFDDGTLLGIASITSSSGVNFSQGASPPNLPGGNLVSPAFVTTAGFLADSNAPVSGNGVSQGEWLAIDFDLTGAQTYSSVINALALPNNGGTGDLRIGLHLQRFASGGGNESFINLSSPIPEPETYAMFMAGLSLMGFLARRRKPLE